MAERIYKRQADGTLLLVRMEREAGKTYSDIGTDPDGAVALREWDAKDFDQKALDEAAARDKVPPKSLEEKVAALEAEIAILKQPKL